MCFYYMPRGLAVIALDNVAAPFPPLSPLFPLLSLFPLFSLFLPIIPFPSHKAELKHIWQI